MSELKQENMKSEDYIIPSTSLEHSYMTEDLEEEYDGQENFKHEDYNSEENYENLPNQTSDLNEENDTSKDYKIPSTDSGKKIINPLYHKYNWNRAKPIP